MHVCVRVRVCACAHLHFCILLGCHDAHVCVPCLLFHIHSCIHFHRHAAVYMCSVALHRPVCLTQHILRSLSRPPSPTHLPALPLPLFPHSHPLLSIPLCLAGTYMHVCRLCTVLAAVARANLTAMQPCVH